MSEPRERKVTVLFFGISARICSQWSQSQHLDNAEHFDSGAVSDSDSSETR